MGERMAMTPVCLKYWINGIVALWASAICVCWIHILGIKVHQKYISVCYRHCRWFLNVDCTLSLSLRLCEMPKILGLYMKYVCIWVYTCALDFRVRILHSAEEDNLSPLDLNITCLCQSIEIKNNKHIYAYIDGLVQEGRGSGALAVEMCLSCTNPRKFISVYRTCLCAGAGGA